ncbi:MAG: phosphatidylserine decarboxylase family protein [Bacteroidaceae bacterium]|nr:phosphatidylserine decarboxylase family protein [Bacteroidaceae bacterium]
MAPIKKLKKTRLHYEGTHMLVGGFMIFLALNAFLFWAFSTKIPFIISSVLCLGIYLALVNFFRCPVRTFTGDKEGVIVAPADGKVVVVEEVDEQEYFHEKKMMISIFMSVLNVHANWFPMEGVVTHVSHQNGNYAKAYLPKASTENERSTVVIKSPKGVKVLVRQVAGAMARRVVTYAKVGQECHIDEHLGFIKFGSRVDIYLPIGTEVLVSLGDLTTADQTVIAKLK